MGISKREKERRRRQTEALVGLSRIHRVIESTGRGLLVREEIDGITPAQANALMILFESEAHMTARQLALKMGISQVTVGRFIRALIAAGWVKRMRDPVDARAWLLSPTARAYRELPAFIRVSNGVLDAAFQGMGVGELRALATAMDRVRCNLESS